MLTYRKTFNARNTLITYGVWERHQTIGWKELAGTGTAPTLFDVHDGVADVHYHGVFRTLKENMEKMWRKDADFFEQHMDQYERQLHSVHPLITQEKPLPDLATLLAFVERFQDMWINLDISYMPDYLKMNLADERRSAVIRERAFGFYIGADTLIRRTLEQLFPQIRTLVSYITPEELQSQKIPSQAALESRATHFIYFRDRIFTDISLDDFCRKESLRRESVYAPLQKNIHGQSVSDGVAEGLVQIFPPQKQIIPGSILIARDLDSTDIPSLINTSAIILDKGNYYAPAAIAARILNKPCIIGTEIASMVFQDGDRLRVDATNGVIHLLS